MPRLEALFFRRVARIVTHLRIWHAVVVLGEAMLLIVLGYGLVIVFALLEG